MKKIVIAILTVVLAMAANAEVKPVGVESHMLKCHSTQMNADVLVPCCSEKDVYLSDQFWDEVAADEGDIPGFKRTEMTIVFDSVCEDASKLLEPSNSFYIVVDGPEYKERSRVWKSRETGKFYQKRVSWTKIGD